MMYNKEIRKRIDNMYNKTVILHTFCRTNRDIEEISNILPLIEDLEKDIDFVNTCLINITSVNKRNTAERVSDVLSKLRKTYS